MPRKQTFVKIALVVLIACTLFVFIKDYLKTAREGRLEKAGFFSLGMVGFIMFRSARPKQKGG